MCLIAKLKGNLIKSKIDIRNDNFAFQVNENLEYKNLSGFNPYIENEFNSYINNL